MSDKRLRARESTRGELRKMKGDGETFSDVLLKITPEEPGPEDQLHDDEDYVALGVNTEAYERVMSLQGDDVPISRIIEYYLYKSKVEEGTLADWILDDIYDRGGL